MDQPIESMTSHKDLGVLMTPDDKFDLHINNIIKKAKQKIRWLCHSFRCRELFFMKQMYISFIRPQLDYCSQLWCPSEGPLMDRTER